MLLLSDGTVMAADANTSDAWYRLTPDIHGSYAKGTWTTLQPMAYTRLYFSSQVLRDGRVFVAGGEYGTGAGTAEVYDPVSNTWTEAPPSGQSFLDSISETLPNGDVLIAPVTPATSGTTILYNPSSNSWSPAGRLVHGSSEDEASWVKLPDDSILTIDFDARTSERYIPSINSWVNDAVVPVDIYDAIGEEMGAGFLLADGRAFFLGATGNTVFYKPSGGLSPGVWTKGPVIPAGLATPDAPAAMMVNGKILCAFSPKLYESGTNTIYPSPTTFYEFDPVANTFSSINGPTGASDDIQPYVARMLDLPDGTVLFSSSSELLYIYLPDGTPLPAGQPVISGISRNVDGSFHVEGALFNGISEGAAYGDDAQMASNYPLVRMTNGAGNVYYARTRNWSSVGVMTGNAPVSTDFTVPANLPAGPYSLVVVANGNSSAPISITTTVWSGATNGSWDATTLNWRNSGGPTNFNPGDFVTFDDSLTGSSQIELTSALAPGGVNFNNSKTNYTVSGPGGLTGATGLGKAGAGTLTLAETGGDNFSGGIGVFSGVLILDNANAAITGGSIIAAGGTLKSGNNDNNGALPAGNVTNNGALVFDQIADTTLGGVISGTGILVKNNANTLVLNPSSGWTGETIVNAGALALAGGASLGGSTNIYLAAGAELNVANGAGATLALAAGQTLRGDGAISGGLAAGRGSIIAPGADSASLGTLAISSNATLRGATVVKLDAATLASDQLSAESLTFGGVLSLTNLSDAPFALGQSFSLFSATNYNGAFAAITPLIPGPGLAWNTNGLAVNGSLGIGYTVGDSWRGDVNGNWDTTTVNWSDSGVPGAYTQNDIVTFDDSVVGATDIVLVEAVAPGGLTFNNSSSNFLFTGPGSINGAVGLVKNYSGSVTLAETGGDNFSGGISVNGGVLVLDNANSAITGPTIIAAGATLQSGENDLNGDLPSGNILLNGRLVLNHTNTYTLANAISGFGSLVQSGSGVLVLFHNNLSWTGAVAVTQGVLKVGEANALGRGTNVLVTVGAGATLDVNGVLGTNAVVAAGAGAGGAGAVVNNNPAVQAYPAISFLTLAGDTTLGGVSRWDLRPVASSSAVDSVDPTFAGLSTGGHAYNLTKTGPNFVGLVSLTVDPSLADVSVQQGTLDLEGTLTGLGNSSRFLNVYTNATVEFYNLGVSLDKTLRLYDGSTLLSARGDNSISGTITLEASGGPDTCVFNVASGGSLSAFEVIGGTGSLVKSGAGTLYLDAANSYKGATVVNAGVLSLEFSGSISSSAGIAIAAGAVLDATDRSDLTLALARGQTLQGSGTVNGLLTAGLGSTVAPGTGPASLGSLTVSSNITLAGSTVMKLNPPGANNDSLHGSKITYGGTLAVTNISTTPLAAGASFRLFVATHYAGAFASITPPQPGPGLVWDTSKLAVTGALGVEALPQPGLSSFSLSGSNLVFNATNGVAPATYQLLASTNLLLPLDQWTQLLATTPGASGNLALTVTNPMTPQAFYILRGR
jgi:autotransporter-associated beta strand protein